jgi:hypothetical protein
VPRTRTPKLLAAVGLGVALALAGCENTPEVEKPPVPKAFNFIGEVRLSGSQNVTGNLENCAGVGRYVDLYTGAYIVVTNQNGKPIAQGVVSKGFGTNYYNEVLDECSFGIKVLNVPRAKGFFIVVGRQRAQPVSLAWVVSTNGIIRYDINPPTVRPPGTPTTTPGIP